MAGIGFELKKLFNKKGLIQNVKAYSYSSMITIGPAAICILLVLGIQWILSKVDVGLSDRLVVTSAIVYAYVFSQVITSGFTMLLTRWISDKIYTEEYEEILPSLYGGAIICLPLVAGLTYLFYSKSPLSLSFKLSAYSFNIQMTLVWLLMTYVSALKDFKKIVISYVIGAIVSIVTIIVLLVGGWCDPVLSAMISMNIGFLVVLIGLVKAVFGFLQVKGNKGHCFGFLAYLEQYPELLFVNFFYTLGMYIHNIIYWLGERAVLVSDTYLITPYYDTPSFIAFMSMLPTMVYFVVRTETSFYEKYRHYYGLVTDNGRFAEIEVARENMSGTLWEEIRNMIEMQMLIVIGFVLVSYMVFSKLGISSESNRIFIVLLLGSFSCSIMYVLILLLLYYDDRRGSLFVTASFFGFSIFGTYITSRCGLDGFGFFAAATLSMFIAYLRMNDYMENINYYTFSAQPVIYKEKGGLLSRLADKLI